MTDNLVLEKTDSVGKIKTRDEKYIKKNFTDIEMYILDSIVNNDRPKLEVCLQYKGSYDLNKCINNKGTTLLHYAASTGKDINITMIKANNIISCMINSGANPEIVDCDGLTPKDYAQIRGFWNAVEVFTLKEQARKKKNLCSNGG